MVNPAALMQLMQAKNEFEKNHPKFSQFAADLLRSGVQEGSVIEVTITRPDGSTSTANMRVQSSDLELFRSLKELR